MIKLSVLSKKKLCRSVFIGVAIKLANCPNTPYILDTLHFSR